MKNILSLKKNVFLILLGLISWTSCSDKDPYYEKFSSPKKFTDRTLDLNKSMNQIQMEEKGLLLKENVNYLEYLSEIGESDSYIIAYRFDSKGCFEVAIYAYFVEELNAKNLINKIKEELTLSKYGPPKEDNFLSRWNNSNESISIEIDYSKMEKGEFIATIFANE
jgi:hypothetical protein